MKELVIQGEAGKDVTTSLLVAEVFGKVHKRVLQDIRELTCSEQFKEHNFVLKLKISELGAGRTRKDPYYEITKDGFSFLVMGYTGAKAGEFKERFINEFNKREAMLKSDDYILMRSEQILKKRIEDMEQRNRMLEEQNEQQAQQIKQDAPKLQIFNDYITSEGTLTTTQIAKEYGWGAKTLNEKLRKLGIQYKQHGQWLLYDKYAGKGYAVSKPTTFVDSKGVTITRMQTYWTAKGREFIHHVLSQQMSLAL